MPVNESVVDALCIENLKTVAGFTAAQTNLAFANSVSNQQTVNGVMVATLGKIAKGMTEVDVAEAGGLVALLQQAMKGAGNTPPVTP